MDNKGLPRRVAFDVPPSDTESTNPTPSPTFIAPSPLTPSDSTDSTVASPPPKKDKPHKRELKRGKNNGADIIDMEPMGITPVEAEKQPEKMTEPEPEPHDPIPTIHGHWTRNGATPQTDGITPVPNGSEKPRPPLSARQTQLKQLARERTESRTSSSLALQMQLAQYQRDKFDTLTNKLAKLFFGIFLLIVLTAAFLLAKTSLAYIVASSKKTVDIVSQMFVVCLVPMVFTIISDIMYFWVRETKVKKKDPKTKKVRPHAIMLIAILEGAIEGVGLAVFILLVLPKVMVLTIPLPDGSTTRPRSPVVALLLLNGLCVMPIIFSLTMKWYKWLKPAKARSASMSLMELDDMENGRPLKPPKKKEGGSSIIHKGFGLIGHFILSLGQLIFLGLQLGGMGLLMYVTGLWWEIPLSLITFSITWWKNFVFLDRLEPHWAEAFKRSRYASSLLKTIIKLGVLFFLILGVGKYMLDFSPSDLFKSLGNNLVHSSALQYQLLACFVAYFLCWTACSACLQILCMALPIFAATPLAVAFQLLSYGCKYYVFVQTPNPSCNFTGIPDFDEKLIIAGGVALWLSFVIVSGHLWTGVDKRDSNQLEEDMWSEPEWFSCIFLEQSLALNRNRNPKVVKSLDGTMDYGYHAHRTYITTTMYHESKNEMTKLVMSLLQIDAEIPREDKVADYYEGHIIFDDAYNKGKPLDSPDRYNKYVLDLVSIFHSLKLKKVGEAAHTWYGEALTFKFALGMKLVVHLKNVTKVKQKKRWSQILYMNVIIEDILDNEIKLGMFDSNTFILMIDGDTQFTRKSVNLMRYMLEADRERTGAVCGRIFPEGSSNPIVWYQKFEYAVGHWLQKTAEHVFGTVLCSPGCFSLVRAAALYRRSGEDMNATNTPAIETYSHEVSSAMDVLKFDQGEDRMLSTLIIKNGWRLQYCASAVADTFCPESFGDFFKQRRRWISSTLANLYFLISAGAEIIEVNSSVSPPFILYTAGVFASSIFGPATVILIVIGGMAYAFSWQGMTSYVLGLGFPLAYAILCIVFGLDMETDSARKKAKKIDIQVGAAFLLNALYALLMAAVMVGIAAQMAANLGGPDAIYLVSLVAIFLITSFLHGELKLLIYGFIYLFFLPTMYLILIMFAMANIHDQSWGTRDGGSNAKETDADKFISVSKIGRFLRDIKKTFKEALSDEEPPEDEKEAVKEVKKDLDPKKEEEEWKKKKEADIEAKKKEEAAKKKQEKEELERLEERIKQERRRAIVHRYKDLLSNLSRRLKKIVTINEEKKETAEDKLERIQQLAELKNMGCFLMFLVTVIWLIMVVTVGLHPELYFIKTNSVGLMFLVAFGLIMILQFIASILHRLETAFNRLANIPMTVDCTFVEEGTNYTKLVMVAEAAQEEPAALKLARKLLMVDRRTATKANIFA